MTEHLKRLIYLSLGGFFFMLGLIGVLLPIIPTTPFMILSGAFLAKSSPRLHQMLLNNRWIGEDLRTWESNRTMKRVTKKRATWLVIISFSISIIILWGNAIMQLLLFCIALFLLFFMWRIPEQITSM